MLIFCQFFCNEVEFLKIQVFTLFSWKFDYLFYMFHHNWAQLGKCEISTDSIQSDQIFSLKKLKIIRI